MKILLLSCLLVACQARTSPNLSNSFVNQVSNERSSLPLKEDDSPSSPIPRSYDARQVHSRCHSLRAIGDQGACGASWAVAVAEAISDRYCIQSKGRVMFNASADDILSCCEECFMAFGCFGGYTSKAWEYWVNTGVVSGGHYESHQGCKPYELQPCGSPVQDPKPKGCEPQYGPRCVKQCETASGFVYEDDLHYGQNAYTLSRNVESIQREILKYGTVVATMEVHDSFFNYNGGVYVYDDGERRGYQSVRLIGWDNDKNGVPYWIGANSWGQQWGENGFFRIRRGRNDCAIESNITAGSPKFA